LGALWFFLVFIFVLFPPPPLSFDERVSSSSPCVGRSEETSDGGGKPTGSLTLCLCILFVPPLSLSVCARRRRRLWCRSEA
jgi:hypothetical protein